MLHIDRKWERLLILLRCVLALLIKILISSWVGWDFIDGFNGLMVILLYGLYGLCY